MIGTYKIRHAGRVDIINTSWFPCGEEIGPKCGPALEKRANILGEEKARTILALMSSFNS